MKGVWGGVGTGQVLHLSMYFPTHSSMRVFLQGPVEKGSREPAPVQSYSRLTVALELPHGSLAHCHCNSPPRSRPPCLAYRAGSGRQAYGTGAWKKLWHHSAWTSLIQVCARAGHPVEDQHPTRLWAPGLG